MKTNDLYKYGYELGVNGYNYIDKEQVKRFLRGMNKEWCVGFLDGLERAGKITKREREEIEKEVRIWQ